MTEVNPDTMVKHPMLDPISAIRMKKGKIVTAEEAVSLIRDGDTLVTEGFVGAGFAEELAIALKVSSLFASLTLGIACRWLQGGSRLTRVKFGGGATNVLSLICCCAGKIWSSVM